MIGGLGTCSGFGFCVVGFGGLRGGWFGFCCDCVFGVLLVFLLFSSLCGFGVT